MCIPRSTRSGWRPAPAMLTSRAAVMRPATGAARRAGARWRSHPVVPRRRAVSPPRTPPSH
eukprot:6905879-Lingulodinium_polyedra.AAC.1